MQKSYYLVVWRPAFADLLRAEQSLNAPSEGDTHLERIIVALSQGGFGQDVVDEIAQVKERFLEFACEEYGVNLPRTADDFDVYFELVEPDCYIDLDQYS